MSKKEIQEMLVGMGFEPNYIQRAFKVYEKNYGHSYNVEVITEIIVRLQVKDKTKKSKAKGQQQQQQQKQSPNGPKQAQHASAGQHRASPQQAAPTVHIQQQSPQQQQSMKQSPQGGKGMQAQPSPNKRNHHGTHNAQSGNGNGTPVHINNNNNSASGMKGRKPQPNGKPAQMMASAANAQQAMSSMSMARFQVKEVVMFQGQDAEVMRILNDQYEITFPASAYIMHRKKALVSGQQLQKKRFGAGNAKQVASSPPTSNSSKSSPTRPMPTKTATNSTPSANTTASAATSGTPNTTTGTPSKPQKTTSKVVEEAVNMPVFLAHMTQEDARRLSVHDKIDHRDQVGRFVYATVSEKQGTNLKIHYDGWSRKWDTWSDYANELHRFAYPGSISQRPAHRFSALKKSDYVDINPSQRHFGWKCGEIRRLDQKSGQVQVVYEYMDKNYLYWAHLDNVHEIAAFTTRSGMVHSNQMEILKEQQRVSVPPVQQQQPQMAAVSAPVAGKPAQSVEDQYEVWSRIRAKRYPRHANEDIKNKYDIGEWLEVEDTETLQWVTATVIDKENNWIVVHFDGWPSKYDQKIHVVKHGKRLRELGVDIPETQEEKDIKQEMDGFLHEIEAKEWKLTEVDADGNCLYRCFAISIYGDTSKHKDVRSECMQYMRENQKFFCNFIPDWEQRMKEKEADYEWGDHVDITALSELYNVRVRVFEYDMAGKKLYMSFDLGEYEETNALPLILLARHRKKHYNIIENPEAEQKPPLKTKKERAEKEQVCLREIRLSEDAKQEHKEGGDNDGEEDGKENADDGKAKAARFDFHAVLSMTEKQFVDTLGVFNLSEPLNETELQDVFEVLIKQVHKKLLKEVEDKHKEVIHADILERFWEQQFGSTVQKSNNMKRWINSLKEKVPNGKYPTNVSLLTFNQIVVAPVSDNIKSIIASSRKRQSTIDVHRSQQSQSMEVDPK